VTDKRPRAHCAKCGARIIVTRDFAEECDRCIGVVPGTPYARAVHSLRMRMKGFQ
jgi:hypothetical protein